MKVEKWLKNPGLQLGVEYLWRYQKRFLTVAMVALGGAVLGSVVPLILNSLVALALQPQSSLWPLGGLVLIWILLDQTHNWTARYTDKHGAFVAWDASADLFVESMWHLLRLPMSFLGEKRLGKIMSRIDRSAEYLERIIRNVAFSLLPHFLTAVLGLIFTLWLDWRLGLILIGTVVAYLFSMFYQNKRLLEGLRIVRQIWEESWGYFWDLVGNLKAMKSNNNEEFEESRIQKNYLGPFKREKEIEYLRNRLRFREHLSFGLGAVAVLSGAIFLLREGVLAPGAIVAVLFYVNLVFKPFSQLAHNWRELQEAMASLERTAKFQQEQPEDYQIGGDYLIKGDLEFRQVTFSYQSESNGGDNDQRVFEDINFSVKAGEIVALVGESGAGKTTMVDLISRYFTPLSGQILIDGRDIREWSLKSLRSQIAMVPQDVWLFNDTVRLNIAYGDLSRHDSLEEIKKAANEAYAHHFIASARFKDGYDQMVGERGIKVSAGQRQRLAIARAFLRQAQTRLLILDEITSALDAESEEHIQRSLEELTKNKTTFIIAHRLSTIRRADKILVLDGGKIAQMGCHNELIKQEGPYRRLVKLQVGKITGLV